MFTDVAYDKLFYSFSLPFLRNLRREELQNKILGLMSELTSLEHSRL